MVYLLTVVLIGAATLSGCTEGVLDPKGPIAAAERQILFNSLGIMLAIVIPTILATLGVAYWFRSSNKRAALPAGFHVFRPSRDARLVDPDHDRAAGWRRRLGWLTRPRSAQADRLRGEASQGSGRLARLEMAVHLSRARHRAASIKLTVPVGTPVSFELTSSGVMNSFFVPQLGGQIYTMAGMATRLHLQADHLGTYRGLSASYSGSGFADMRFTVDAVPAEKFAQWVDCDAQHRPGARCANLCAIWPSRARPLCLSPIVPSPQTFSTTS